MKKAILATKIGMTQIFAEDGELIPVTVLQAGPCEVTQVKTVENDGYSAVQVGFQGIRKGFCGLLPGMVSVNTTVTRLLSINRA